MARIKYVRVCPACGSGNYQLVDMAGEITGADEWFKCNDCHYTGQIFPEVKSKEMLMFQKEAKKHRIRHGKCLLHRLSAHWLWVIVVLALLIAFLMLGGFDLLFTAGPSDVGARYFWLRP